MKRITEGGKYAVEFNSLRRRYEISRATITYRGPGYTFKTLKEAQNFRDQKNSILEKEL